MMKAPVNVIQPPALMTVHLCYNCSIDADFRHGSRYSLFPFPSKNLIWNIHHTMIPPQPSDQTALPCLVFSRLTYRLAEICLRWSEIWLGIDEVWLGLSQYSIIDAADAICGWTFGR
ncbi:hypothetical protein Salat_1225000 [Sesamum alatum]|uniref:Uncharacterized protein n=1 Tax=Sesamum alatum TaxID=300844 RepID=A0AAE1YFT3_9LAMI|nr:hypothetical protein Salat_1225000 [Sesamum alatum]